MSLVTAKLVLQHLIFVLQLMHSHGEVPQIGLLIKSPFLVHFKLFNHLFCDLQLKSQVWTPVRNSAFLLLEYLETGCARSVAGAVLCFRLEGVNL